MLSCTDNIYRAVKLDARTRLCRRCAVHGNITMGRAWRILSYATCALYTLGDIDGLSRHNNEADSAHELL